MNASSRSTFVTVVAWVFMVPAGFGLLIGTMQVLMFSMMFGGEVAPAKLPDDEQMPAMARLALDNFKYLILVFPTLCAFGLATCVGLLRRRNWARLVFVSGLGLGILWNFGGLVFQLFFFELPVPNEEQAEFVEQFESIWSLMRVFMTIMALAVSALFGWIIWKLCTKPVKEEFHAAL